MFAVGDKVECVRSYSDQARLHPHISFPENGEKYTIRTVGNFMRGVGVRLFEIKNSQEDTEEGYGEPCFIAWAFRLIIEKKTDISLFSRIKDDPYFAIDGPEEPRRQIRKIKITEDV